MVSIEENNKAKCCGCNGCENICHNSSITMIEDEEGFKYPKVNLETCTRCNMCEKVCPVLAEKRNKIEDFNMYACYNNEKKVLNESSSGGIFTVLAEYVLDKGGVVYGAAVSSKDKVTYVRVDNKEELHKLRGSKYVQSELNSTYREVKKLLNEEVLVLFSGAPCQVYGLSTYLGKEYENLILCDFICSGVASPKLFRKYIEYLEQKFKKVVKHYCFRSKVRGWNSHADFSSEIVFEDGTNEYIAPIYNNSYITAFLKGIASRPICYECPFKLENNVSDIKLADFWGIKNVLPEMYNTDGTSLIVVHTEKGKNLFNEVSDKITSKEVEYEKLKKYQPKFENSAERTVERDKFMNDLANRDYTYLKRRYLNKYLFLFSKAIQILKRKLS